MNRIIFAGGLIFPLFFLLLLLSFPTGLVASVASFNEGASVLESILSLGYSDKAATVSDGVMCGTEHCPHWEQSRDGFFFSRLVAAAGIFATSDFDMPEAVDCTRTLVEPNMVERSRFRLAAEASESPSSTSLMKSSMLSHSSLPLWKTSHASLSSPSSKPAFISSNELKASLENYFLYLDKYTSLSCFFGSRKPQW